MVKKTHEVYVLVTGGFDPLHSGHIEYLHAASMLGGKLIVGLNSDAWLRRKKGKEFLSFEERHTIISHLDMVDSVICFDDEDGTAINAIHALLDAGVKELVYANGGDRSQEMTPEYERFKGHPAVTFEFGVGGNNKMNSSSWILDNWKTDKTERDWGYWRVLDDKGTTKVKELVIEPGKKLSNQKHQDRNEHWYLLSGTLSIVTENEIGYLDSCVVKPHETFIIKKNTWHMPINIGNDPCHIIEVQYGSRCVEEDIERK